MKPARILAVSSDGPLSLGNRNVEGFTDYLNFFDSVHTRRGSSPPFFAVVVIVVFDREVRAIKPSYFRVRWLVVPEIPTAQATVDDFGPRYPTRTKVNGRVVIPQSTLEGIAKYSDMASIGRVHWRRPLGTSNRDQQEQQHQKYTADENHRRDCFDRNSQPSIMNALGNSKDHPGNRYRKEKLRERYDFRDVHICSTLHCKVRGWILANR